MTASNQLPMDPLIEGYLSYLDKVGRKTPRTIIDVRCPLRRALSGLRRDIPLWHLQPEDYLHWLEAERRAGCTETSLAKYLSHLRGFLNYAWRSGRSERNVLDGFTLKHALPRTPPSSLTLEEAEKLVQATSEAGPAARRDRLVVLLLYGCGLRTDELCSLDVAEINRERHELLVLHGKGDRPRVIPIPEALYTELLAYPMDEAWVFASPTMKGKQPYWPDNLMKRYIKPVARKAGITKNIGWHTFRHSFGTLLKANGEDIKTVQELLRHAISRITLDVYTQAVTSNKRAAQSKVVRMMVPDAGTMDFEKIAVNAR